MKATKYLLEVWKNVTSVIDEEFRTYNKLGTSLTTVNGGEPASYAVREGSDNLFLVGEDTGAVELYITDDRDEMYPIIGEKLRRLIISSMSNITKANRLDLSANVTSDYFQALAKFKACLYEASYGEGKQWVHADTVDHIKNLVVKMNRAIEAFNKPV